MNKTITLLFALLAGIITSNAQNYKWAKRIGGNSYDDAQAITVDASGNVYCTGSFQRTVDFNPNSGTNYLTSAGIWDIYITKLDTEGNLLWAKSFGGTEGEEGRSIVVDSYGNVYTTGYFKGTADFDPGPGINNLTSEGGV